MERPKVSRADRRAYSNNQALMKAFRRAGGLNPDFFGIDGGGFADKYTRKDIERLQHKLWGGRWGKPRPDAVDKRFIRKT